MRRLLLIMFVAGQFAVLAQDTAGVNKGYPQDYFRNPLDIPIFLAGNFGECRPGHFHSGTDIKTLGKENQPVHAAADGYISRIKMDKTGFGHALYITHPNGYTTLYAHLNDFAPPVQKYLKSEQYAKQHWDIDIQLKPDQFPVKKGQLIAYSGNTGASTAPHLHFEIRNTKTEHPLNPELFGLPIVDNIPPKPAEVVVYRNDASGDGFYNMERNSIALKKEGEVYQLADVEGKLEYPYRLVADTIVCARQGSVGIGLNVNDYMNGSDNTIAFYTAQLYLDDSLQCQVTLDDIGYDVSRYVNAYADYKIKQQQNKWIQCFFKLPGNHLDNIYTCLNDRKGWLFLGDNLTHKVHIVITDDRQNRTDVVCYLRSETGVASKARDFDAGAETTHLFVNRQNYYADKNVRFSLGANTLYDDVVFTPQSIKHDSGCSDKQQILFPYIPAHSYFDLELRPNKTIPPSLSGKVAMMYSDDKDIDGRSAAIADSGWYKARVRDFGTFWLDIDTVAPVIKLQGKNNGNMSVAKQITFEVKDDKTSVKKFSGYLDGKWICFEQHNDLFFYKFDEHCSRGQHTLVFNAEDENGNAATYKLSFKR